MTDYIKRDIERIIANAQECDIDALTWEEQKERLKAVKSADVAPVRHGRWIESKLPMYRWGGEKIVEQSTWKCSVCHDVCFWGYNYCPNCGAHMMDEEK